MLNYPPLREEYGLARKRKSKSLPASEFFVTHKPHPGVSGEQEQL